MGAFMIIQADITNPEQFVEYAKLRTTVPSRRMPKIPGRDLPQVVAWGDLLVVGRRGRIHIQQAEIRDLFRVFALGHQHVGSEQCAVFQVFAPQSAPGQAARGTTSPDR